MNAMDRLGRPVLIVLAIMVAGLYLYAYAQPSFSLYHDDGLYMVNGQSLATGRGYRTVSLPHELYQTKYPPVFAILLAAVWKLVPDFSRNLLFLKAVPAVCLTLWILASVPLLRSNITGTAAAWVIVLALSTTEFLMASTLVLPDTCFALATAISIWLLMPAERSSEPQYRRVSLSALSASIALLTRTMGVALIAAAILTLLWRRRWREAALYTAICVLAAAPWFVWMADKPASPDPVELYYTNASYQNGHIFRPVYSWPERVDVVLKNLYMLATAAKGMWAVPLNVLSLLGSLGLAVLAVTGFFRSCARGITVLHVWIALYIGMLTCWVWPPLRYLVPAQFFLFMFAAIGMGAGREGKTGGRLLLFVTAILSALAFYQVSGRFRDLQKTGIVKGPGHVTATWAEVRQTAEWIQRNTGRDAIVTANLDPIYYLLSGRKAIRAFGQEPYEMFYRYLFAQRPQGTSPLGTDDDFTKHLIRQRIDYVVLVPMNQHVQDAYYRGTVFRLARAHPEAFQLVMSVPESGIHIFGIHRAAFDVPGTGN